MRIVSTAPSITEMLYALGLGDRVVGVTTFCHYPPEAARKPKIGNYLRPDVEAILALRPDLVIAERSMIRQAVSLPQAEAQGDGGGRRHDSGHLESIRVIGRATGAQARAEGLCTEIRNSLESLRQRTRRAATPRVLFIVGRTPGRIEDLIAAGGSSYLSEVIEAAGGENVMHDTAVALRQGGPGGSAGPRPGRHHRHGRDGPDRGHHRAAEAKRWWPCGGGTPVSRR